MKYIRDIRNILTELLPDMCVSYLMLHKKLAHNLAP